MTAERRQKIGEMFGRPPEIAPAPPERMPSGAAALHAAALATSLLGVFVAGCLTYAEAKGAELPCPTSGDGGGCGAVLRSAASHVFGVPVAWIGLAGWVALALASVVGMESPRRRPLALRLGYLMAGFGVLVSLGLTGYAVFGVRAVCVWCLASAVTMALHFACRAALASLAPSSAALGSALVGRVLGLGVAGAVFAVPFLFSGAAGAGGFALPVAKAPVAKARVLASATRAELIPPDAPTLSGDRARLTLVVFSDFRCPSCDAAWPRLRPLAGPDVRLVYRHFPSGHHPGARALAEASEVAGAQGRFWPFLELAHERFDRADLRGEDVLRDVGASGLPTAVDARRVDRDLAVARRLGLGQTPTIVVLRPGHKPEVTGLVGAETLARALGEGRL